MTAQYSLGSKLLAEFVGTMFLIVAGLGVFISTAGYDQPDLLAVALAHGLAIGIGVTAIGHVSGGHLNPAITVAMMVFRRIDPREGVAYIVAQLLGGVAGSYALLLGFDLEAKVFKGAVPTLGSGLQVGSGMFLEAIATFLLAWTVFAVAIDRDGAFFKVAGMPIGFAVTVGILVIGPATGGALNPARWFGPALMTGEWSNAMVWVFGPIAGAIIAGAAYLYGIKPRLTES